MKRSACDEHHTAQDDENACSFVAAVDRDLPNAGFFKELSLPFLGVGSSGLKPRIIFASNPALERRSSTVVLASVVPDTSKTSGAKAPALVGALTARLKPCPDTKPKQAKAAPDMKQDNQLHAGPLKRCPATNTSKHLIAALKRCATQNP
jgi:hypothetical protein